MAPNQLRQGWSRLGRASKSALRRLTKTQNQPNPDDPFAIEKLLIDGKHQSSCIRQSVIHFTFNRAASQYVKQILRTLSSEVGLVPVALHDYSFQSSFPYLDAFTPEEMQEYSHIFRSKGYLYSVFGGMIDGIPELDEYKVILLTRDPRDLLVSMYYSIGYSHVAPPSSSNKRTEFDEKRAVVKQQEVDQFVIDNCEGVRGDFVRYERLLLDRIPNVFLTSYEQMVNEFPAWLDELIVACDFKRSRKTIGKLLEAHEERKPKGNDPTRHDRRGKVGDYRDALKPETVEYLNREFADILPRFGY